MRCAVCVAVCAFMACDSGVDLGQCDAQHDAQVLAILAADVDHNDDEMTFAKQLTFQRETKEFLLTCNCVVNKQILRKIHVLCCNQSCF